MKLTSAPTSALGSFSVRKEKYSLEGRIKRFFGIHAEPTELTEEIFSGRRTYGPVYINTEGVEGILEIGKKIKQWYFYFEGRRYRLVGILPLEDLGPHSEKDHHVYKCSIDYFEILPDEGMGYHGQTG